MLIIVFEGSLFFTSLSAVVIFCVFSNSHSNKCEVTLIVVLICISLMISDVEQLSMCLLGYYELYELMCVKLLEIVKH